MRTDRNAAGRHELLAVLRETRSFLALPGNDFSWSSWEDASDALLEINGLIWSIEAGSLPERLDLTVLFVVAGPIQEVSLSGWADEFLALATRFDAAVERVYG